METGGKDEEEMIRKNYDQLCEGFGVAAIHSEYSMTVTIRPIP
jgi:hypothetical protein